LKALFRLAALTAISVCASSPAFSQLNRLNQDFDYPWAFRGAGARAAGMGSAYTAVRDEMFSGTWNPANLAYGEKIYFGASVGSFMPKGKYDFSSPSYRGESEHTGNSLSSLSAMALTLPITIKNQELAFSASLYRNFDAFSSYADKLFPSTPEPIDMTYERKGGINTFALGFGTAVNEKLSIGLSVNIYNTFSGPVTAERRIVETYPNYRPATENIVLQRKTTETDSFSVSGINATLGLSFDWNEATTFGLAVRTPFKIRIENDNTIEHLVTANGGPAPSVVQFESDTLINSNVPSRVDIPLIITLGAAHEWSERFLSTLDFEYGGFSGSMVSVLDETRVSSTGVKEDFFHEESPEWGNTFSIRTGAEYKLDSKLGAVPLRAGFGFSRLPSRDVTDYRHVFASHTGASALPYIADSSLPYIPSSPFGQTYVVDADVAMIQNANFDYIALQHGSQVSSVAFSFGSGLHSPQRKLDFAYTITAYSRGFASSQSNRLPANYFRQFPYISLLPDSRSSEGKNVDHRFTVSFIGYF